MGDIRQEVRSSMPDVVDALAFALAPLKQPLAEDKLAGILVLSEHVIPGQRVTSETVVDALAGLFAAGHIWEWNTCDWLCNKAIHKVLERERAFWPTAY